MFMVNQLIGFGASAGEAVETLVDRTTGTNIGNMTSSGGLAAAFDGNTNQTGASSASTAGAPGYVGKTYGAGKRISKVIVYGSNNEGYAFTSNASTTIVLRGKNGAAPASRTDGTSLGSITFTDTTNESAPRTITSSDQVTTWLHVFVDIDDGLGSAMICTELEIYELI